MKPSVDKSMGTSARGTAKKEAEKITKSLPKVTKPFTKTEIVTDLASTLGIPQIKANGILPRLIQEVEAHLQKGLSFTIPGLLKVCVVDKPATKERQGTNPFTREPITFAAKPARKAVKVKLLKGLRTMI